MEIKKKKKMQKNNGKAEEKMRSRKEMVKKTEAKPIF